MSNAPFKIAFWVMSLAFGLTVLLTGLKPEAIRSALNPKLRLEEEELAHRELFPEFGADEDGASLNEVNVASTNRFRMSLIHPGEETFSKKPIRVASADPNASLGFTEETLPVESDQVSYANDSAPSRTHRSPHEEEIHILVPDPVDVSRHRSQPRISDEVVQLKRQVLRLQLARAQNELQVIQRIAQQEEVERVEKELKQLRAQIREFQEQRHAIQDADKSSTEEQSSAPKLEIPASVTPEPMPIPYVESENFVKTEPKIEVTAGTREKTFSFYFENADIHDVLETLAERAGWKIVIHSEVQGEFSGNLENVAPKQAFATVIRLHGFGVSFRGDHVLVHDHKTARNR